MQNDSLYNDFTLEENIKILCDDEGQVMIFLRLMILRMN